MENPDKMRNCPKKLFKESTIHPTRTIFSLEQSYLRHQFYTQDKSVLIRKEFTKLRSDCYSVTRRQLLKIQPCNFIPPSLHLIQGLCQDILKAMEESEPILVENFEAVYKSLKADKKAWHQHFTGSNFSIDHWFLPSKLKAIVLVTF
uniref:Uncharacterized protein n=1 Tax=Ditylenchus dipsaci TaxID=166011 RepID=A0A915CWN1_9BILA